MREFKVCAQKGSCPKADVLVLPFLTDEGEKCPQPLFSSEEFGKELYEVALVDFKGTLGESFFHYAVGGGRVLLLGLGSIQKFSQESLRSAFGSAIVALRKKGWFSLNVVVPKLDVLSQEECVCAVSEGVFLADYVFDAFKTKKREGGIKELCFFCDEKYQPVVQKSEHVVNAVSLVRDLVVRNADEIDPDYFANLGQQFAKRYSKMAVNVLRKDACRKEKMGLLCAVNQGSPKEPAVVTLHHRGNPKTNEVSLAIVGKGITYDTGGLSLKPANAMETMREDMAGAGVVFGTMQAIAELDLPINVVGVIGATENAIGPNSYKPGDVFWGRTGVSVEIVNTDAEGRLVLADVLSYTQDVFSPKKMINLATLTGAVVVALGESVAGVMGNHEGWVNQVVSSGKKVHERVWPLPLYDDYQNLLDSEFADMKNCGSRNASSITAGMFLKKFVKDSVLWAHIDIAGVAFAEKRPSYCSSRATGFGVRLLLDVVQNLIETNSG